MSKTYAGKVDLTTNPNDRINKVVADDFNEIASDIERLENLNDEIGLDWDSVHDTYVRTGALASFGVDDSIPNSFLPIQSQMRRCTLNTDGTVNYYLDSWVSTKKVDGTASDLTGADGNVEVEIPEHWYRYFVTGDIYSWRVSVTEKIGYTHSPKRYIGAYNATESGGKLQSVSGVYATTSKTITAFRTYATAITGNNDWHLFDHETWKVVAMLYLTEYASFNSQLKIGLGNTQKSAFASNLNGLSDGNGNQTANESSSTDHLGDYMTYRGIENIYGNIWQHMDGCAIRNDTDAKLYVCTNPAQYHSYAENNTEGVATGYDYLGDAITTAGDYGKVPLTGTFVPISVQSANDEFMCDMYYCSTNMTQGWRSFRFGGHATSDMTAGMFFSYSYRGFTISNNDLGTRLCYTDLS